MLDIKSVMEALESAGSALASSDRGSIRKEFSLFRAYKIVEADTLGVTLMGLPYVFQSTSSAIITSNGTISTGTEGGLRAKAKVLPVVNFKTQIDSGVLIPFTQKFVGASLEVGVHSSLSFELEAKMEGNEIKMAIKVPQEHHREQTETLHGFVLPYTVIDSYVSMRPTTLAHFKKPILTGLPKKIVEKQVFPRSFGLHCELKLESDNEFIDFASYYHKIKEHSIVSIMTFPSILVSSLRHTSAKILFSPARSETKEIEFVLKLGSQRHGIINHEVEEIKEAIIKHEMHSLKQALESMTEGSKTHMVHLDAILKGESGQKTIKAGIVLGYKPLSHHKTKSVLAIDVKPGHLGEGGETYGILWECELEMPKVEYRWNVEKLLAQNLRMKLDSKIKFGRHSGPGSHQEVKVKAEFLKTEEQIKSVREAVEYQKCEQEIREGKLLSPICMKVRHEAASLDKLVLSVEVPSRVSRMWLWRMLEGIVFSDYFPMVQRLSQNYEVEVEDEVDTKKVMIEGRIDRVGQFAKAKVTYGQTEYEIKGVPVPRMIRWFMPFSVRNNLYYWFLQRATSNQAPASCRVEPKFVGTFDNVTYPYAINDCGHVLVIDRRRVIPVAIMTRTYPGSNGMQKSVKILAGKFDIELIPTAGVNAGISSSSGVAGEKNGPIEVKVNGREVTIERGQTFAEKSAKTGRIVFEVERYMDDVYQVYVQDQWLEVMTNGKHIEVVVPQTFRARSAGLCGDLNGEKTTDLKSPRMCILKAKVAGVAYMLGKSSGGRREEGGVAPQCSGIPSELKEEYEEEERECIKEHVIPTHLASHLHQLPHLVKPKVASHAILITRFDVCLSREAVDVHPGKVRDDGGLLPAYKKPRVLTFVCVPKQSAMSGSLLWRARAGENLGSVLKRMPIAFKKHIHGDLSEVQVPGLEDSLRRSHFHQNQMNHFQNEYYNQNQYQNQMVEEEEEMMAMDHFRSQEGFSNDYHQHHHNQQYNSSPYNRKYLSEYEEESSSYEYPPSHMRKANNHRHHKKAYLNGASLIEDEEEDMYQKFPRSSSYSAAASSIME